MMKLKIKYLVRGFMALFFNPRSLYLKLKALPHFLSNISKYIKLNDTQKFKVDFFRLFFYTVDKFSESGNINHHYFHQDLWMAKKIYNSKQTTHYDVGSRIDGFVAHLLTFCKVNYVDIRPLNSKIENLNFIQGSILNLPFETESIESLSCLHVIEHIGLGRYGDPIDPLGHIKSAEELIRVLKPGGILYFSTPIGKEFLHFDAHRVFSIQTIKTMFHSLEMIEFAYLNDKSEEVLSEFVDSEINNLEYGCGLFLFKKQ